MTWFKVDDGFHASHKLNSIPARHRFQAAGLWVIAGSWVGQQETDGHVPDYMIKAWGATRMTVESLVSAGLWRRERGGYSFCSWLEYNPSKEDTDARRAASAERMRRSRERRRAEATGQEPPPEDVALQRSEVLRGNGATVLQCPDPSRPDPTRPDQLKEGGEVVSEGTTAREKASPPPQIPETWIENPRLARCAVHAGIDDPPPCVGCRDARRSAEEAGHSRAREQMARAAAVKAERDACDLCDPAGFILGVDEAIRCTHDPDRNGEAVLAADTARREREAEDKRARDAARAAAAKRQEAPRGPF